MRLNVLQRTAAKHTGAQLYTHLGAAQLRSYIIRGILRLQRSSPFGSCHKADRSSDATKQNNRYTALRNGNLRPEAQAAPTGWLGEQDRHRGAQQRTLFYRAAYVRVQRSRPPHDVDRTTELEYDTRPNTTTTTRSLAVFALH